MKTPRIPSALLFVTLILMYASTALAVLPPEAYEEARTSAQYHALVRVTGVKVPSKTPGECTVTGTVEELLRKADDALAVGAELSLDIACRKPNDEIPDGGTLWTQVGELQRATVIDAYLNKDKDGERYRIPRDQVTVKESGAARDDEGDDDSGGNIALYAGFAIGALVAAIIVFLVLRRRKA